MKHCNPGFGSPGTTQNCSKASSCLELKLRGINATAGRQTYPAYADAPEYWWKGAEQVKYESSDCEDELKSYGPGTSGTLSFKYPDGAGHMVHWTNSKSGKFSIEDGQNGKVYSSLETMLDDYGADINKPITTYRLDNCEPDFDAMAQDSVIRTPNNTFEYDSKVYNIRTKRLVDTW